jgi:molybdenum cofactor cytidylyltransferase
MTKTEEQRPRTSEVAGLILAGGRSHRMGAFKPLLPFGNQAVIDHCVDNLRKAGIDTVVVVLGQGSRADDLKEHLKDSQVTTTVNPDPASEMSSSVAYGVRALPATAKAVVIIPVDHPAVSAEVVSQLIDEWKQGARLLIPTWDGRGGHPVLVDLSFRDELLNLHSARGLKSLFEAHQEGVKRLSVDSSYIARDMDTWDDYAALHADVFGVLPPKPPSAEQE